MFFDAKRVPLSARGSYLCFSVRDAQPVLVAADTREQPNRLFTLQTAPGTDVHVCAGYVEFTGPGTDVRCTFYDKFYMVLSGTKPLRMQYRPECGYVAHTAVWEDGCIRICDAKTDSQLWFSARKGALKLHSSWQPGRIHSGDVTVELLPENGAFEVVFLKTASLSRVELQCPAFSDCCAANEKDFAAWCERMHAETDFRKEMAFVLWQNTVAPLGNYHSECILCAKASMNAVWSWDHCFHALGISAAFPEMAFDQFMVIFTQMDAQGALPDTVTPRAVTFGFTKPPVHAYIYKQMMERHPYFTQKAQIERIYPYLCKNFHWWLHGRAGAPVYWHGNDSGADNATCFDRYPVIQSPDLYALLAVTAEVLADFAEQLGDATAAAGYARQAVQLGRETEARFFDGERFFVRPADDHTPYYSGALLPLRCLVAGKYLSEACVKKTVALLQADYLGDYGLTSEAFSSPNHTDGMWEAYWRGSVWGCDQILFAHALRQLGYHALAGQILQSYRHALRTGGAAENSNSRTGAGNCTAGYSWAAAAEFYAE